SPAEPDEPLLPVVLPRVEGIMPGGQSVAEAPLVAAAPVGSELPVLLPLGELLSPGAVEMPEVMPEVPVASCCTVVPLLPEVVASLAPELAPVVSVEEPEVLLVSCEMTLESAAPLVPLVPLVVSEPAAKAMPELAIKARK